MYIYKAEKRSFVSKSRYIFLPLLRILVQIFLVFLYNILAILLHFSTLFFLPCYQNE